MKSNYKIILRVLFIAILLWAGSSHALLAATINLDLSPASATDKSNVATYYLYSSGYAGGSVTANGILVTPRVI